MSVSNSLASSSSSSSVALSSSEAIDQSTSVLPSVSSGLVSSSVVVSPSVSVSSSPPSSSSWSKELKWDDRSKYFRIAFSVFWACLIFISGVAISVCFKQPSSSSSSVALSSSQAIDQSTSVLFSVFWAGSRHQLFQAVHRAVVLGHLWQ